MATVPWITLKRLSENSSPEGKDFIFYFALSKLEKRLLSEEEFLNAETYAAISRPNEEDWKKIKETAGISVGQIAQFLTKNPKEFLKNSTVQKIRNIEKNFKIKKFVLIEACPNENGDGILLVGGNKSAIAYAIKILNGKKYKPVLVYWHNKYDRYDTRNKLGMNTTKD